MCIQLFEVSGAYSGKVYSFCTSVQWQKITVTSLRMGTKGQLLFLQTPILCYLPMHSMYLGKKRKILRFCIPPHLQRREIGETVHIFAISQTTISSWCVFFFIVNLKINKGIPTNYCLCSCGGKKNQILYINITPSNLLPFWKFGSKKPVKELFFFFFPLRLFR